MEKLNTTIDFELCDGTKVQLTLNFYFLYQLKSKERALYERYNKIMQSTNKDNMDIMDMVTLVYVAYRCANFANESVLSEEDFYMMCGSDMSAIGKAVNSLIRPKKR